MRVTILGLDCQVKKKTPSQKAPGLKFNDFNTSTCLMTDFQPKLVRLFFRIQLDLGH